MRTECSRPGLVSVVGPAVALNAVRENESNLVSCQFVSDGKCQIGDLEEFSPGLGR